MTFDNRNYSGRGPGPIGRKGCPSSTWSNIAIGPHQRAGQVNRAAWRSHARAPIKYDDLDVHPSTPPTTEPGSFPEKAARVAAKTTSVAHAASPDNFGGRSPDPDIPIR
jgi:hypothetical protein